MHSLRHHVSKKHAKIITRLQLTVAVGHIIGSLDGAGGAHRTFCAGRRLVVLDDGVVEACQQHKHTFVSAFERLPTTYTYVV